MPRGGRRGAPPGPRGRGPRGRGAGARAENRRRPSWTTVAQAQVVRRFWTRLRRTAPPPRPGRSRAIAPMSSRRPLGAEAAARAVHLRRSPAACRGGGQGDRPPRSRSPAAERAARGGGRRRARPAAQDVSGRACRSRNKEEGPERRLMTPAPVGALKRNLLRGDAELADHLAHRPVGDAGATSGLLPAPALGQRQRI